MEPLLASSFPLSHPEWAPLNLELTKACQKISFQKIMGLMGLLTNGWGFIFCYPWVQTIFPFFKKGGAVCIFVSNNWIRVEGKSLCGMTFLWNQISVFWNISRTLSGLKSLIARKRFSHCLQKGRKKAQESEEAAPCLTGAGPSILHFWQLQIQLLWDGGRGFFQFCSFINTFVPYLSGFVQLLSRKKCPF